MTRIVKGCPKLCNLNPVDTLMIGCKIYSSCAYKISQEFHQYWISDIGDSICYLETGAKLHHSQKFIERRKQRSGRNYSRIVIKA
jgi:hypothetical protein